MNDRDALAAMAAFLPRLRQEDVSFGHFVGTKRAADGTYSMPYWSYSDLVKDFIYMAYRSGWVSCAPWVDWAETAEGRRLLFDPHAVMEADLDQLRRLLTALIRKDRFCDGTIFAAFESGLILRVVTRARDLLDAGPQR